MLDFELRPGIDLRGEVTGPEQVSVEGTEVSFLQVQDDEPRLVATTTMSSDWYKSEGLHPGRWLVRARKDSLVSADSEVVTLAAGAVQRIDLRLEPGTLLRVAVSDATGEPVEARISVQDSVGRLRPPSPQEGTAGRALRLVGPLPPGTWTVTATPTGGGASASKTVTLGEDAVELQVDLELAE